jgi:uncharacterized protein YjbJ (UPF0337 family)
VLGNEQIEAEGRAKEVAGEAEQEAAKAARRVPAFRDWRQPR